MNQLDRIVIDPAVCHGKPTIRGLRYPVEMILELLSSGMTADEILADYEDLEHADIMAALQDNRSRTAEAEPRTARKSADGADQNRLL